GGNLLLVRFRTQAGTGLWGLSLSDGRASPLVPPNRVAVRAKSIVTPWPFLREAGQTAAMASISIRKFGFASPRSTQSVLAGGSVPNAPGESRGLSAHRADCKYRLSPSPHPSD